MTENEGSKSGARKPAKPGQAGGTTREDRLAAALRANLQRRKAQSRARAASTDDAEDET